jgi:hypothetical protein
MTSPTLVTVPVAPWSNEFVSAMEAPAAQGRGELRMEDLDGDPPPVLQVFGKKDRGHAATAELALDRVLVLEGRA